VRVSLDQPIALSAPEAQAAFSDPAFYRSLGELPGISAPAVLSFSEGPSHTTMVLGYRFAGELNSIARKLLDPGKLTWSQTTEVDLASRRTEVRMVPDHYAGLFSFDGWYELRATTEGRCCQHLEADLRVHLPLLGPLAERGIATAVRENLAATARLVERYAGSVPRERDHGPGGDPEDDSTGPGVAGD